MPAAALRMIAGLVTVSLLTATLATVAPSAAPPAPCERAPTHAQPADATYSLGVAGDPDLFLPGELYTVSLQGVNSGEGPTPFIGFTLWVELDQQKTDDLVQDPNTAPGTNVSLGVFQAYDAQTKAYNACSPAVTNATTHPKIEIQVIWSAPLTAADMCVRVCARVGPASVLARKLCAAPAAPAAAGARQPPLVEPCCACDEAKYEVTFEGHWSRNTHPREFPPESARAHFGDLIGASHTAQYRVWQEGRAASAGLRRLADDGATTQLEKELKAESEHIRTIIKARGISWQQVQHGGNPSTFAVFRVDAKHHLVSLASKLAPSPDWIVGVSALELCNANCTWTTAATLPLYPYDAGTDTGLTYTSPRQATLPPAAVRALRPDWPKDPRSPFYNEKGAMRAFARLRLTRLRLYEKSCDAAEPGPEYMGVRGAGVCATHAWGAWSACSATCGGGRQSRQRTYVYPKRAYAEQCRVALTDHRRCYGPRRNCRFPSDYEPDAAEHTGPCALSTWSEWSPCQGCGVRMRTRQYASRGARKRCHVGFRSSAALEQTMPCDAGECRDTPSSPLANTTGLDWIYMNVPPAHCPTTEWGLWSPCSAHCGRGHRIRTRLYLVGGNSRLQSEVTKQLLRTWNRRFSELQGIDPPAENVTADTSGLETRALEHMERCHSVLTQQETLCDGWGAHCEDVSAGSPSQDPSAENVPADNSGLETRALEHMERCHSVLIQQETLCDGWGAHCEDVSADVCKLPLSVGHCRSYQERWFYDATRSSCEPFGFTGCGGNANNFATRELCRAACLLRVATVAGDTGDNATATTSATPPATSEASLKKSKPLLTKDNEVMQHDAPADDGEVDCEVGPWLGWSRCPNDCEYAIKLNYRLVTRAPSSAGKPCAHLVKSRSCRPSHCRQKSEHTHDNTSTDDD